MVHFNEWIKICSVFALLSISKTGASVRTLSIRPACRAKRSNWRTKYAVGDDTVLCYSIGITSNKLMAKICCYSSEEKDTNC